MEDDRDDEVVSDAESDVSLSLLTPESAETGGPNREMESPAASQASLSSDSSSSSSSSSLGSGLELPGVESDADEEVRAPRAARRPGQAEVVCLYAPYGELRYNVSSAFVRAHCWRHGDSCRKQRACYPNEQRPGQGRPLGLLAHWLESAANYRSAQEHKQASVGSFEQRSEARERFLTAAPANIDFAQAYEAEQPPDTGPEPQRVP